MNQDDALSHLRLIFSQVTGCCLAEPAWTPDDVSEVLATVWSGSGWEYQEGLKEQGDSNSVTIVLLSDGDFGMLEEAEDYTGHGCQCHAFTGRYSSSRELLTYGIPENHGARLLLLELLIGDDNAGLMATPEGGPDTECDAPEAPRGSAITGT